MGASPQFSALGVSLAIVCPVLLKVAGLLWLANTPGCAASEIAAAAPQDLAGQISAAADAAATRRALDAYEDDLSNASDLRDIWLLAILPFTGGEWDAGGSLRFAANIMIEEINNNPAVLPGYRLRIVYQDSLCKGDYSRDLLLRNVIDQEYLEYGGNPTDTDGDGYISTEESLSSQNLWNTSQVESPVVGLFGGGCSTETLAITNVAYRFRLPIISPGASNTALSDRSTYPNFFRTVAPDSAYLRGWCLLLQVLGVTRLFALVGETSLFSTNLVQLVSYVGESGIEFVGNDLKTQVSGLRGYQLLLETKSAVDAAMEVLRATRARVVGLQIYGSAMRLVMCAAYSSGLYTQIWIGGSLISNGFEHSTEQQSVDGFDWCGPKILAPMANGMIVVNIGFWRSDDETVLTCTGNMTAAEFRERFYLGQEVGVGENVLSPLGYAVQGEGACAADAACMWALGLHALFVERGVDPSDLEDRRRTAYNELFEILSVIDFEGVQGRLAYEPGVADPEGGLTFTQVQSTNAPCVPYNDCNEETTWVQVATQAAQSDVLEFEASLKFHFDNEVFIAAGTSLEQKTTLMTEFSNCGNGKIYDYLTDGCTDCPENQTFSSVTETCRCQRGFFLDDTVCQICPAGKFSVQVGATTCTACRVGHYAEAAGHSSCERCPKATYSNTTGSTSCEVCPTGMTTDGTGFSSEDDCQCQEGSFALEGTIYLNTTSAAAGAVRHCAACGEGASCAGNGAEPQALPGYYLYSIDADGGTDGLGSAGLSIFRCFSDSSYCPGGGVQACAEGREGISCARCKHGLSSHQDGTCQPCNNTQVALPIAMTIVAVLAMSAIYFRSRQEVGRQSRSATWAILTLAQLVALLQTCAVLSVLTVDWPEPLNSFLADLQVLYFNLEIDCLGPASELALYSLRVAILPAGAVYVVLLHFIFCLSPWTKYPFAWRSLVSPLGTLCSAFFISMCMTVLCPFQCNHHPNQLWTLANYEGQLCWTSEHYVMLVMGCVGTLFPLCFLALVARVLYVAPFRSAMGDTMFLARYEFIFNRFQPGWAWLAFAYFVRNLLIACTPIIPDSFLQFTALYTLFLLSMLIIASFRPWKTKFHNISEVGINAGLNAVVYLATNFADVPAENSVVAMTVVALSGCCLLVLAAIAYLSYLLAAKRCFKRRKQYRAFLCHHKAAAGAIARLLKLVLCDAKPVNIFLDSDDLLDLRSLFDIVTEEVELVVALATQELLLRPWCLGEITTAYLDHVSVQPVDLGFTPPTEEFIESIGETVNLDSLSEVGLSARYVEDALRWLAGLEVMCYPTRATYLELCQFAFALDGGNAFKTTVSIDANSPTLPRRLDSLILIAADSTNENSLAASLILYREFIKDSSKAYLWHQLHRGTDGGQPLLDLLSFAVFVPVCTSGCWLDPDFLAAFKHAASQEVISVPVFADETFVIPTPGIYDELRARLDAHAGECEEDFQPALDLIQLTFKRIAVPLSVMAAQRILAVQVNTAAERIRKARKTWGGAKTEFAVPSNELKSVRKFPKPPTSPGVQSVSSIKSSSSSNHGSSILAKAFRSTFFSIAESSKDKEGSFESSSEKGDGMSSHQFEDPTFSDGFDRIRSVPGEFDDSLRLQDSTTLVQCFDITDEADQVTTPPMRSLTDLDPRHSLQVIGVKLNLAIGPIEI